MTVPTRGYFAGTTAPSFQIGKGGASIMQGSGVPDNAIGQAGDFFLRTGAQAAVYQKVNAAWSLLSSVSGGVAATANALTTARTISMLGDVAGSISFDGSADATFTTLLASSGVLAGTYSSYVVNNKGLITAGRMLNISGDATGTSAGASISLVLAASGVSAGTYGATTVTPIMSVDGKGRITSITSVPISYPVASVNGQTGSVSITSVTGNAATATQLATARTIALAGDASGSIQFDGSVNATLTATLASVGTTGTYSSVVVDTKGRVTSGTFQLPATVITGDIVGTLTSGTFTTYFSNLNLVPAGTYTSVTVNSRGLVIAGTWVTPVSVIAGDVVGSAANGTLVATLAASGVTAGTYNTVTVDTKGRVIAASNASYGGGPTAITLTGDVAGTGLGTVSATLAATGIAPGTYGLLVIDTKGRATASQATASFPSTVYVAGTFTAASAISAASLNVSGYANIYGILGTASISASGAIYANAGLSTTGLNASASSYLQQLNVSAGISVTGGNVFCVGSISANTLSGGAVSGSSFISYGSFTAAAAVKLTGLSTIDPISTGAVWSSGGVLALSGSTYTAPFDGGKNLIHNSMFRINQRGVTSVTSNGLYPVDRWFHVDNGNGSRTVSQVTLGDADRAAIGDEVAAFAVRIQTTGSSGAGDYELLIQNMENVRNTSGKTVTLSYWAKAAAAAKLATEFYQSFGSGGSPSTAVSVPVGLISLTTAWTRYSQTISIPSTAGKTLGSVAGTDALAVNFWTSAGSTYATRASSIGAQTSDIQLWGVQVEFGSAATAFEHPQNLVEFLTCQRFFQIGLIYAENSAYTTGAVVSGQFCGVVMRSTPTLAIIVNNGTGTGAITLTNVAANTFTALATSSAQNNPIINVIVTMDASL